MTRMKKKLQYKNNLDRINKLSKEGNKCEKHYEKFALDMSELSKMDVR